MHYLLFYEKAPDYAERQKPFAAAHLDYMELLSAKGDLLLGGSLENPTDGSALLVFKASDAATVEAIAKEDPYVKGGIISRWWVRKWDVVVGSELAADQP